MTEPDFVQDHMEEEREREQRERLVQADLIADLARETEELSTRLYALAERLIEGYCPLELAEVIIGAVPTPAEYLSHLDDEHDEDRATWD